MSVAKLIVPRALGNQPATPSDDPLAELVAMVEADTERYFCMFDRDPDTVCTLGKRAGCAWGVCTEEDLCCMFVFIKNHPEGAYEFEIADALGMSRERVRQWLARAVSAFTIRGGPLGAALQDGLTSADKVMGETEHADTE